MSTQTLNSLTVQNGMKDILLNYAQLWASINSPCVSTGMDAPPLLQRTDRLVRSGVQNTRGVCYSKHIAPFLSGEAFNHCG